jgi:hypothetical protein
VCQPRGNKNDISTGREAMKNDIIGKIYNGQGKVEDNIMA